MNLKSLLTSTRFLWLGLILLIAAILLEPEREETSLQEVKPAHIEKILAHRIRELENESKILLDSLAGHQPDQVFLAHDKEIRQLCDDDRIALFLFHQDSLIMWSDHSLALEEHWLSRMVPKTMVKLPNAWVYTDVFTKGDYRIVGMVPVKRIYPYENNYIHNHFLFDRAVPSVYEISTIPRKGALQINGPGETFLFYLIPHPVHDRLSFLFWLDSILYILSLFFYLALLADLLRNGYRLYKSNWWLIALLADLVLVRWILFYFNIPGILVHTSLFKPLNTPVSFLHSHGDILLTVVFILFFSYQVFKLLRIWPVNPARRRQLMDNRRITDAIGIGVWVAVLMLFLGTEWIINNVLTGHDHMLEIYRILTIDKYVLVDVGAEIVLHVSILLIVIRVVRQLSEVMSTRRLLRGFVPAVTVIYGVTRFAGWGPDWFSIIYLIIVVVILVLLMHQPGKKITPVWTVVLLMLLSAHAVQHIYFANQTKESGIQKKIIQDLANEHDPVAEMLLAESSPGIQNDTILSRMIIRQTPRSDRVTVEQHVTDYLRSNYFDHYWTRYQIQANICDSVNLLMLSPDNIEVPCLNHYTLDILKPMGQKLPGTDFYYIDNFDGLINYLGVFRIYTPDSTAVYHLFINIDTRLITRELGYPDLLIAGKNNADSITAVYAYAKYKDGMLASQSGDYEYSSDLDIYPGKGMRWFRFRREGFDHLIFRMGPEDAVILSHPTVRMMDYLVTFSYLFIIIYLVWIILSARRTLPGVRKWISLTLKQRIQITMVGIFVVSFLFIGGGLVYYNLKQYRKTTIANIREKTYMLLTEMQHKLEKEEVLQADWTDANYFSLQDLMIKFSYVFNTDINLFSPAGTLITSSRPEVYDRNLTGRRMDPRAYYQMHYRRSTSLIHREKIGELGFYSSYIPFYNIDSKLLAYINLPYFSKQQAISREITTFIVAILNIFLLLIFFATILTVLLSNQVTRPLRLIQEKLSVVRLGEQNQGIAYNRDDEIGSLVREYNRMVNELQKSADKLARSERETAWREMARQIAHEIKNPLTPMKLSVQHLQKALKEDPKRGAVDIDKLSRTLIDQIDTLSAIASEFSRFAQMPRAKFERIDLLEKVRNAITLFKDSCRINLEVDRDTPGRIWIKMDKEHIMQVFNNLIRNAIQSVPEGRAPEIRVSVQNLGERVLVTVSDNGAGIPEEVQLRMFQPNFTTKSSGTGLGLAITKRIIEAAGGRIWFETIAQKGSTFFIELPVYDNGDQ